MGKIFLIVMRVDFTCGRLRYRQQHLQGTNELIAKAIGLKKLGPCDVFDTTAGLGREAFLLAALGCEVTLFERNPTMATLLKEGLAHAKTEPALAPIIARMHFFEGCAIDYLLQHPQIKPSVIYCDPMFPVRTKSALVKKEMQWLQSIVGTDADCESLIEMSLARAKHRVVVKRPVGSDPLIKKPDFAYTGRSHRFDVYILHPATCSKPASCKI